MSVLAYKTNGNIRRLAQCTVAGPNIKSGVIQTGGVEYRPTGLPEPNTLVFHLSGLRPGKNISKRASKLLVPRERQKNKDWLIIFDGGSTVSFPALIVGWRPDGQLTLVPTGLMQVNSNPFPPLT